MLIYRSASRDETPARVLDAVVRAATVSDDALPDHDEWVELLIEAGELEAAIADLEMPAHDDLTPLAGVVRRLVRVLGHAVVRSWAGNEHDLRSLLPAVVHSAREVAALTLPDAIRVRVPEGYAYYGLYPETYMAAARQFYTEVRPARVMVLGIRSIGTSLSAVVAATLAECGAAVRSCTVRPRGHPFFRTVSFGERLADAVREASGDWFAIVDEGPGLSGSSFAATAEALVSAGVQEERIVFFPSWIPQSHQLSSQHARNRWPRHRAYVGDFDAQWLRSGLLTAGLGRGDIRDLSGGAWRDLVIPEHTARPAVQRQHEQRKLLFRPAQPDREALLLKFVGLGRYGRRRLERAAQLHASGWQPHRATLTSGFLVRPWIEGTSLAADDVDTDLLDTIAHYAAYLGREHTATADVSVDTLLEMIRTNTAEALGEEWRGRLAAIEALAPLVRAAPAAACDARMLPHEWLRTASGLVKTDALAHHDDHFLPGPQNIAWDLAGAAVELSLDRPAEQYLLDRYVAASGDEQVRERMPFFRAAYLAFRVGYATLAAQALGDEPDAARFRQLRARYATALREHLLNRERLAAERVPA